MVLKMVEYINFSVDKMHLEDHVKRICRNNLRRPANICRECPFLGPVIDIMEENGWKYNKEEMKKHVEQYRLFYPNCE